MLKAGARLERYCTARLRLGIRLRTASKKQFASSAVAQDRQRTTTFNAFPAGEISTPRLLVSFSFVHAFAELCLYYESAPLS